MYKTVNRPIRRAATFAVSTIVVLRRAREPSPRLLGDASSAGSLSGNCLNRRCWPRYTPAVADRIRILSGMRPTGRFHLGNYLGAAKNWVELQNQYECFYFVADYHALTTEPDGHKVEDKVFDLTADLLAVGIDPKRSVVYQQSKVPEVAELTLLLSMVTPLSWVQRVPTFKEMAKQHPDNVNLGLFSYPILQADIPGTARAPDRNAAHQGHRRQAAHVQDGRQHRRCHRRAGGDSEAGPEHGHRHQAAAEDRPRPPATLQRVRLLQILLRRLGPLLGPVPAGADRLLRQEEAACRAADRA